MDSTLTRRKPEEGPPKAVQKDGDDAVETRKHDRPAEGLKALWKRLPQKLGNWFAKHPEMALVTLLSIICIGLLRSYSKTPSGLVLFDAETLALYNGKKNAPLYLAILGEVFDVTTGRRFYGGETGYAGFVGRDATRAFVTGDFTPRGLTDAVEDFTPEQFKSLVEWRAFYHKQYTFKGRLVGRFYNSDGLPKRLLKRVEEEAATAKSQEELQREEEAQWPSCNVRWTESEGGTVWCDGGTYPRKVFMQLPGGKPTTKCACFQELGWSDIRQVYPDCAPDAHSCKV